MKKYLFLLLFAFLPSLLMAQDSANYVKRPSKKKKTEQRQQQTQRKREAQPRNICPDSNHPHVIDLGLPSGTKWACCNVGSSKPEGYGNYYAWGETKTKSVYSWGTYQYGRSSDDVDNIGSDIAGTRYDAATANWGTPWKMPTKAQCEELKENTTSKWTTHNGVKGRMFTSKKKGCSLFLPAAGGRRNGELDYTGSGGYYWSSSLREGTQYYVWYIYFFSGSVYLNYFDRYFGRSVRPVRWHGRGSRDRRSSLLTLGKGQTSLALPSLTRSLAPKSKK